MVELTDIVLAAASFGTALALMYITLRDYTYPKVEKPFFDDRKVFMLLTLGIVLGMVFFFIDAAIGVSLNLLTIIPVAIGIAVLQALIKLSILNYPKLQRKVDTGFYGLALGTGIASTYAFSRMFIVIHDPSLLSLDTTGAVVASVMVVMMGIQIVMIQSSTSAIIAVGVSRGQPWNYFAYSLIFAMAWGFLIYGSAAAAEFVGDIATVGAIIAGWLVASYSYWHVYVIDLPNLIDDAKRGMKGAKKIRKAR